MARTKNAKNPDEKRVKESIGFRLSPPQMLALDEIVARNSLGMSLDLYAKEVLLEHMGMKEVRKDGPAELSREVNDLRRELARAMEVLLLSGIGAMQPFTVEQAKAWIHKNFKLGRPP